LESPIYYTCWRLKIFGWKGNETPLPHPLPLSGEGRKLKKPIPNYEEVKQLKQNAILEN
jgi:hypothetical protein